MQVTYDVDERPPFLELLLLGLQWMAIVIPIVIIIGRIVGEVQSDQPADQILFMQKTAFLIAVTVGTQVLLDIACRWSPDPLRSSSSAWQPARDFPEAQSIPR